MTFQKTFKENRKRIGYTQEEVATYLNVTPQAVSKWETGLGTPDLALIIPIARLFDISTDELLGNIRDENAIAEELDLIKTSDNNLIDKYTLYKQLLKQSPTNQSILKACINCAWRLLNHKEKHQIDSDYENALLNDISKYRNTLLSKFDNIGNQDFASGKLAEAYIFAEKYEEAKEIINKLSPYQYYCQDRILGNLYYNANDLQKSREHYELSFAAGLHWVIHDLLRLHAASADFKGQNLETYDPQKCMDVVKHIYTLIETFCDKSLPYPYHMEYIKACEYIAQGYMDMGDKESALKYLSELVSLSEEWNKYVGQIPPLERCFPLISDVAEKFHPISPIDKQYLTRVFARNKYKRFDDDERFTALQERIKRIIQ